MQTHPLALNFHSLENGTGFVNDPLAAPEGNAFFAAGTPAPAPRSLPPAAIGALGSIGAKPAAKPTTKTRAAPRPGSRPLVKRVKVAPAAKSKPLGKNTRFALGFLGSLMQQSPITGPIFNALRRGEYESRTGEQQPEHTTRWDAFLGLGQSPGIGYDKPVAAPAKTTPAAISMFNTSPIAPIQAAPTAIGVNPQLLMQMNRMYG